MNINNWWRSLWKFKLNKSFIQLWFLQLELVLIGLVHLSCGMILDQFLFHHVHHGHVLGGLSFPLGGARGHRPSLPAVSMGRRYLVIRRSCEDNWYLCRWARNRLLSMRRLCGRNHERRRRGQSGKHKYLSNQVLHVFHCSCRWRQGDRSWRNIDIFFGE